MKHMEDLYELCDVISDEIAEATAKIHQAGGMTAGDVDYVDKLTHTLKSLKTTIAMLEAEDGEYSGDDEYSGRMMPYGVSYARGRGRNVKRDAMGRYSSRGYSRAEGVKSLLHEAMEAAGTDREREAIRKALSEMDR